MNLETIAHNLGKGFLASFGTFPIVAIGGIALVSSFSAVLNRVFEAPVISDFSFVWVIAIIASIVAGFYFTFIDTEKEF